MTICRGGPWPSRGQRTWRIIGRAGLARPLQEKNGDFMRNLLISLLTLLLGAGCGYFQYWMATRLSQKRWLLLLQPLLFLGAAVFFLVWSLKAQRLYDAPTWMEWAPFVVVFISCIAGWVGGIFRIKKRKGDD